MSLDNAKGEVEVEIKERNGGSYSNLNFSFFKEYLPALIIAIFGTLLLCVVMWWRATRDMSRINPADVGNFLIKTSLITVGLSAVMFVVVIGFVGYSIALTRRRFIEEFNMFMQSLPSKKD
jgi:ABC-type Fe3+ transport system permease subunit